MLIAREGDLEAAYIRCQGIIAASFYPLLRPLFLPLLIPSERSGSFLFLPAGLATYFPFGILVPEGVVSLE